MLRKKKGDVCVLAPSNGSEGKNKIEAKRFRKNGTA